MRSAFRFDKSRRISSASSWSTQKAIVFANRSPVFKESIRWRAIASVQKSAGAIVSQIIEQVVRQFSPGDRAAAVRLIVAVLEEERLQPS